MLPPVETAWCQYLPGSTRAIYPRTPGDVRVTLISSQRIDRALWKVAVLIEVWATPETSETDALALHAKACDADSQTLSGTYVTGVDADGPKPNDDPDSDLDRYQFMVTHFIRDTEGTMT